MANTKCICDSCNVEVKVVKDFSAASFFLHVTRCQNIKTRAHLLFSTRVLGGSPSSPARLTLQSLMSHKHPVSTEEGVG